MYVGQTGSGRNQRLFNRLKQHHGSSKLRDRWNRFSWYGVRNVTQQKKLGNENLAAHTTMAGLLDHIEAVLIEAVTPALNRQGGRFGREVVKYVQRRDPSLKPTMEKMVQMIWEEAVKRQ